VVVLVDNYGMGDRWVEHYGHDGDDGAQHYGI
jgi:hypothetical protein